MSGSQTSVKNNAVKTAIRSARTRLKGLENGNGESFDDLAALMADVRRIGRASRGGLSAKQAILRHLREFAGRPVTGGALEVVSGIAEYGRRVRDLRDEGHPIVSGLTRLDPAQSRALRRLGITRPLRRDEYLMLPGRQRRTATPATAA